jgi:hypothetical protein
MAKRRAAAAAPQATPQQAKRQAVIVTPESYGPMNPKFYAETVAERLDPAAIADIGHLDDQTTQNARLDLVGRALVDFVACFRHQRQVLHTSLLLGDNKGDNVLAEIAKHCDGLVQSFETDKILRLLTHSKAAGIIDQVRRDNMPDPLGVIGMQTDKKLTQQRSATAWATRILNQANAAQAPQTVVLPGMSVAGNTRGATTTPLVMGGQMTALFEMTKTVLTDRSFSEGIIVPEVNAENFIAEITKAFKDKDIAPEIAGAYIDAAASWFRHYDPETANEVSLSEACSEFVQNVQLNVLAKAIQRVSEFQTALHSSLAKLEGGNRFNTVAFLGMSIDHVLDGYSADQDGTVDEREARQNTTILTLAQNMLEVANSMRAVCDQFSLASGSILSRDYIAMGVLWNGIDPDMRIPEGQKQGQERRTLMHHFAGTADRRMVTLLKQYGAQPDSLQVPIQSWGEWCYSWVHPLKRNLAYVINGQRLPELKGETPLLTACMRLTSATDPNVVQGYLAMAIELIDLGADVNISDFMGRTPYALLSDFASKQKPTMSAEPSADQLYRGLKEIHAGMERGGAAAGRSVG